MIDHSAAIPDYQTFMLPLLKSIADGNDHRLRDLVSALGDEFGVTDEERAQLLPSGRATVLYSRVQWARAYLKQAGLVEGPARGVVRITEEGQRLLAENPSSVGLPCSCAIRPSLLFSIGSAQPTLPKPRWSRLER